MSDTERSMEPSVGWDIDPNGQVVVPGQDQIPSKRTVSRRKVLGWAAAAALMGTVGILLPILFPSKKGDGLLPTTNIDDSTPTPTVSELGELPAVLIETEISAGKRKLFDLGRIIYSEIFDRQRQYFPDRGGNFWEVSVNDLMLPPENFPQMAKGNFDPFFEKDGKLFLDGETINLGNEVERSVAGEIEKALGYDRQLAINEGILMMVRKIGKEHVHGNSEPYRFDTAHPSGPAIFPSPRDFLAGTVYIFYVAGDGDKLKIRLGQYSYEKLSAAESYFEEDIVSSDLSDNEADKLYRDLAVAFQNSTPAPQPSIPPRPGGVEV